VSGENFAKHITITSIPDNLSRSSVWATLISDYPATINWSVCVSRPDISGLINSETVNFRQTSVQRPEQGSTKWCPTVDHIVNSMRSPASKARGTFHPIPFHPKWLINLFIVHSQDTMPKPSQYKFDHSEHSKQIPNLQFDTLRCLS
jgi:hypothetical protein